MAWHGSREKGPTQIIPPAHFGPEDLELEQVDACSALLRHTWYGLHNTAPLCPVLLSNADAIVLVGYASVGPVGANGSCLAC